MLFFLNFSGRQRNGSVFLHQYRDAVAPVPPRSGRGALAGVWARCKVAGQRSSFSQEKANEGDVLLYSGWSSLQQIGHQSYMGATPACSPLDKDFFFFLYPFVRPRIWSRETGSAVRSRVSPSILHTKQDWIRLMLTHGLLAFLPLNREVR